MDQDKKAEGGRAAVPQDVESFYREDPNVCYSDMTLWDYFAAHALKELTFYLEFGKCGQTIVYDFDGFKSRALHYAQVAGEVADALITERTRRFG